MRGDAMKAGMWAIALTLLLAPAAAAQQRPAVAPPSGHLERAQAALRRRLPGPTADTPARHTTVPNNLTPRKDTGARGQARPRRRAHARVGTHQSGGGGPKEQGRAGAGADRARRTGPHSPQTQ